VINEKADDESMTAMGSIRISAIRNSPFGSNENKTNDMLINVKAIKQHKAKGNRFFIL
jgi:hypothetical protein